MCDRMPAFPASVQKVISLTSDINSSPRDLVRVIDHDPVLTMKILKVANSAYFGLSRKVVSINHAVVYLGLNTVKHVALAIAAIGSLPTENEANFDMDDFLLHSLTTAVLTRLLARPMKVAEVDAANFFVAGLLHDMGKVVFAQFRPSEFRQALELSRSTRTPLHQTEVQFIGHHHAEVGAVLCESWDFPADLVSAIRNHNEPCEEGSTDDIRQCLFMGNLLAHRLNPSVNGPPSVLERDLPHWVVKPFGTDFNSVLAGMDGLQADLDQATALLKVGKTV
jgi:putative nucleotidyltransferase with HDIG domain